jgi:thiamine pyrophosphate-dependent acetolactate synthase large subunit-like protein
MKRDVMLKKFCSFLTDADIVIFGSNDLSKEASEIYKPGHFYITDNFSLAVSLGLGIAMCTDKRVFVFVGEGDILRDFGIILQMAASKCQNIFLIIFNNGVYQNAGGFPNIFNKMISQMSVLFSLGCRTFNLTKDFEKKETRDTKHFIARATGPIAMILNTDKSKNVYADIKVKNYMEEFKELLRDKNKKSSLYDPFAVVDIVEDLPILKV